MLGAHESWRRELDPPELELPLGVFESISGSPEEHLVLLIAEPSFQPRVFNLGHLIQAPF